MQIFLMQKRHFTPPTFFGPYQKFPPPKKISADAHVSIVNKLVPFVILIWNQFNKPFNFA